MISTRDAYGDALVELGAINEDLVVLDGDVSTSTRTSLFGEKYPKRFFNVGIAEQNMIAIAAGLAAVKKIPIASSFACFCPSRCVDQIKQIVAQLKLNVKIVSTHCGLSAAADGASHQAIEDIAIMRAMPNFTVTVPADALETNRTLRSIVSYDGPVYVRLSRAESPVIFDEGYNYPLDKGVLISDGSNLTLVAAGTMVSVALDAADTLKERGISARVIDMHTIKPIDKKLVIESANDTGAIITVEDHSIIGGLGSAVAEVLVENAPVPMTRIGIQDLFGESARHYSELRSKFGLTEEHIVQEAERLLKRKA
jgi:transketolase